jgi:hypothetical protein
VVIGITTNGSAVNWLTAGGVGWSLT